MQQDNIYIIEKVLKVTTKDTDYKRNEKFYMVKWLGFPETECTWESEKAIPKFLQEFYDVPGHIGKCIPKPTISNSKIAGGKKYHLLSWKATAGSKSWVAEDIISLVAMNDESTKEETTCNTLKSKDKRDRRHTVGILVAAKPCGIIVLHKELYGSESLTQVYNIMLEYISKLPTENKNKLKQIVYDDACHLLKVITSLACKDTCL